MVIGQTSPSFSDSCFLIFHVPLSDYGFPHRTFKDASGLMAWMQVASVRSVGKRLTDLDKHP